MYFLFSSWRRGICLLFATLAVFCLFSLIPKTAHGQAGVPTFETNPVLLEGLGVVAAQTSIETGQSLYEWAELLLTHTLKKQLLDFLVDQIIGYINGNNNGDTFISNWEAFVGGAIGDAIADFGLEFAGVDLCQPFDFQLKLIFSAPQVPTFSQRFRCSLDDIVGNIDSFRDNFRNGSWLAYQASFKPQNNFWGVYLEAQSALLSRINVKKETSLAEAVAGQGFLGAKECDANGQNCITVTPGRTIGDAVAKAVGSDIDYIVNAQDLAAYTSAIADAMMNRVLKEGLANLSGSPSSYESQLTRLNALGGTSGKKRFDKEKKDTLEDIAKAISLREAGQRVADRSTFDVASITHAISALEYLHTEYQQIQRGDFVTNPQSIPDSPICQKTARGYSWVQNTVLGRIEKRIDQANSALILVAAAVDDDPNNNPETTPGADNTDNLDILGTLYIAQTDIQNIIIGDVVGGVTTTLSIAQDQLLTLRNSLDVDMILNARNFREGMKDLKEDLDTIYEFVEDYNKGLEKCIKNSSAADPMDATTNPTNNWPW